MAKYQSYYVKAKDATSVSEYTQTSGKAERVIHQARESEMRDVCLECPLEECTGGGRRCPLNLIKKGKKK